MDMVLFTMLVYQGRLDIIQLFNLTITMGLSESSLSRFCGERDNGYTTRIWEVEEKIFDGKERLWTRNGDYESSGRSQRKNIWKEKSFSKSLSISRSQFVVVSVCVTIQTYFGGEYLNGWWGKVSVRRNCEIMNHDVAVIIWWILCEWKENEVISQIVYIKD